MPNPPSDDTKIDYAGCAGDVEGLGPGKRTALWVRGCPLACPGCMTPELWAAGDPAAGKSIAEVAAILSPLLAHSDGLTISGGEPMEQPAALANLVRLLRQEHPTLEVLVYSGYAIEDLRAPGSETLHLLEEIDILIDQPFDQTAGNELKWRGSDNQRIHYLTERAQRHAAEDEHAPAVRPLQLQMLDGGNFRIIGIPRRGDMARYRKMMEQRGITMQKLKAPPPQTDAGKTRSPLEDQGQE